MNLLSSTNNGQITGGGAIKKVLAFAAEGSANSKQTKSYEYWQHLIHTHFSETSHLRYTMLSVHDKPPRTFDLPFAFLPRFFHVQYTSGLLSSHFSLNHANEYLLPSGDLLVDAPLVLVTQVYDAGVIGTMLAQLRVILREWNGCWKIEFWDFIARQYEESIPRSLLTSIIAPLTPSSSTHSLLAASPTKPPLLATPKKSSEGGTMAGVPEPIASDYGLSLRCIRTMEIAEIVHYMRDIIQYAHVKKVGALESLKKIAAIAELSQKSTTILGTSPTPPRRTVSSETTRAPSPITLFLINPTSNLIAPMPATSKKGTASTTGTTKRKVERKKKERKKPASKKDTASTAAAS